MTLAVRPPLDIQGNNASKLPQSLEHNRRLLVKVGLHEATPGPALSAAAPSGLVAVGGTVFAFLRIPDRRRRSDPGA